ncbi:hypothetical protein P3L10_025524 [Capsicum annuum]
MVTIRAVLSIAAMKTWKLHQMDAFNAFLQGDLVEDVYMSPPPGLFTKGKHSLVCKLKKSLYGLKQASRQWNLKICEALISSSFVQSHHDYSLFVKKSGNDLVLILVYVDDLLITGSSSSLIEEAKCMLQLHFNIKVLGEMKYFLGLAIARSKQGILVCQMKFELDLIADVGLADSKPSGHLWNRIGG